MNIVELTEITGSYIRLSYDGHTREWFIHTDLRILIGKRVEAVPPGTGKSAYRAAEALANKLRNQTVTIENGGHTLKFVVPATLVGFDPSFSAIPRDPWGGVQVQN